VEVEKEVSVSDDDEDDFGPLPESYEATETEAVLA
jgi:hypothetical protein